MNEKSIDQKLFELLAATDMGMYPAAVQGCNDERDYKQRDGFKNGWNACVMELGSKIRGALHDERRPWTEIDKLFAAAGEYIFDQGEDKQWFVFLNDTWYWACSDCEEISAEEQNEVAGLFREYGRAGVIYWVTKKRGHASEFSPEKEMAIAVGELIELAKKLREQKVYKKENLK